MKFSKKKIKKLIKDCIHLPSVYTVTGFHHYSVRVYLESYKPLPFPLGPGGYYHHEKDDGRHKYNDFPIWIESMRVASWDEQDEACKKYRKLIKKLWRKKLKRDRKEQEKEDG